MKKIDKDDEMYAKKDPDNSIRKENETSLSNPKKVAIVFLENIRERKKWQPHLDFDQDACSYFLVQMNSVQNLFEFQIVTPFFSVINKEKYEKDFGIENHKDLDTYLKFLVKEIEKYAEDITGIEYWIFITSEPHPDNWNFQEDSSETMWFLTSHEWQKKYSPPSLFEYLSISVFTCALYSLFREYGKEHKSHNPHKSTKGCLFDFTTYKPHRRILISNPQLCYSCTKQFEDLEKNLGPRGQNLLNEIGNLLSKNWIGSQNQVDSPHII